MEKKRYSIYLNHNLAITPKIQMADTCFVCSENANILCYQIGSDTGFIPFENILIVSINKIDEDGK